MAPPMSPGHSHPPPSSTSNPFTSFPVLAIAVSGILATAVLLLSYYIFVIKCCRYWRRRGRGHDYFSPLGRPMNAELRGLEPSLVRSLPVVRYSRPTDDGVRDAEKEVSSSSYSHEYCAVCLVEFQEEERLKLLPGCFHAFHIDCIDAWLQFNANCPLCRALITSTTPALTHDRILASQTGREQQRGGVVIEVRDECRSWRRSPAEVASAISPSLNRKRRKYGKVGSMGDECIDLRTGKDEQFCVQRMRRSFSMDSSSDRQLYLSVQEMLKHNQQRCPLPGDKAECGEGSSRGGGGGGRGRRTCFSIGRSSRSPVPQVHING